MLRPSSEIGLLLRGRRYLEAVLAGGCHEPFDVRRAVGNGWGGLVRRRLAYRLEELLHPSRRREGHQYPTGRRPHVFVRVDMAPGDVDVRSGYRADRAVVVQDLVLPSRM